MRPDLAVPDTATRAEIRAEALDLFDIELSDDRVTFAEPFADRPAEWVIDGDPAAEWFRQQARTR